MIEQNEKHTWLEQRIMGNILLDSEDKTKPRMPYFTNLWHKYTEKADFLKQDTLSKIPVFSSHTRTEEQIRWSVSSFSEW